jgi:hypothetical protein
MSMLPIPARSEPVTDERDHTMTTGIERQLARRDERGMSTAEYAVGTVSACGFAGLLFKLLTSDFGQSLLRGIFDKVLGILPF